ncbi:hypothetical protein [Streptomyces sp. NPDC046685]|uniref:hypothetical protein n=1 Tax=Streptomyces sp. NPDC046685 TaxID=3157202 RepID=UPI0034009C8D
MNLDDLLPAWEAAYEPGNVSDYLIGYANSEAAAKGAAVAWVQSQSDKDPTALEWVEAPGGRHFDDQYELIQIIDGTVVGIGVTVRHRRAQEVSQPFRRQLTELEHDAAWHAIEGTATEEGADPGTVLNAVLRALDIDPPGTSWTPCTPAWLATQPAGACDTTPRRDGHDDVSHYHLAAEGAGA